MNAEIIAAGSELLTPARSDTNSLWLTARLNELGVEVTQKTIVGDDRDRLAAAMRGALERVEIVIVTAGWGRPRTMSRGKRWPRRSGGGWCFRRKSAVGSSSASRASAGRWPRSTAAGVSDRRRGATGESERHGAGQWIEDGGKLILLLPGPPNEMQPMFENFGLARLRERVPPQSIRTRFYRVAGMGESDLDQLIAPLYKPYANPVTTILAAAGDIQIHLRARAATNEQAEALAAELGAKIEARWASVFIRTTVAARKGRRRAVEKPRRDGAVAESCTAGCWARGSPKRRARRRGSWRISGLRDRDEDAVARH